MSSGPGISLLFKGATLALDPLAHVSKVSFARCSELGFEQRETSKVLVVFLGLFLVVLGLQSLYLGIGEGKLFGHCLVLGLELPKTLRHQRGQLGVLVPKISEFCAFTSAHEFRQLASKMLEAGALSKNMNSVSIQKKKGR